MITAKSAFVRCFWSRPTGVCEVGASASSVCLSVCRCVCVCVCACLVRILRVFIGDRRPSLSPTEPVTCCHGIYIVRLGYDRPDRAFAVLVFELKSASGEPLARQSCIFILYISIGVCGPESSPRAAASALSVYAACIRSPSPSRRSGRTPEIDTIFEDSAVFVLEVKLGS